MTRNEWKKLIEDGSDIMFDVRGKHFTILTWTEGGINIGEQYPVDDPGVCFPSASALLDEYRIDGVSLGDLSGEVKITDYS